ncbi:hypothetical protein ACM26V_13790 [Salipaludibacillus sp. HK11]
MTGLPIPQERAFASSNLHRFVSTDKQQRNTRRGRDSLFRHERGILID